MNGRIREAVFAALVLGTHLPSAARSRATVVSRDAAGHATVRAVKLDQPLHVDGILNEAIYESLTVD